MARVGLIFGGRSTEHLVSVNSARTVREGLRDAGFEVVSLGISEDGRFLSPERSAVVLDGNAVGMGPEGGALKTSFEHLLRANVDVVFPIIHGTFGEDGTLQGLLEMLDVPYVGAGVATSGVCMDKLLCKSALIAAGLPVVEHTVVRRRDFRQDQDVELAKFAAAVFPLFVKPAVGGSSAGCQIARDAVSLKGALVEALDLDETALVERVVVGRELECAVLGHNDLAASAIGEIVPGAEFYTYADKYQDDVAGLHAPAAIDPAIASRIQALAVAAFASVQGSGMARVDFFLEGEGALVEDGGSARLFINEINTLPGFTRISMYPRLWGVSDLPLAQLCQRLVDAGLARHRERTATFDAIHAYVEAVQAKS